MSPLVREINFYNSAEQLNQNKKMFTIFQGTDTSYCSTEILFYIFILHECMYCGTAES